MRKQMARTAKQPQENLSTEAAQDLRGSGEHSRHCPHGLSDPLLLCL